MGYEEGMNIPEKIVAGITIATMVFIVVFSVAMARTEIAKAKAELAICMGGVEIN